MGISRRKFIQKASTTTSFLIVGFGTNALGDSGIHRSLARDESEIELNQFISIDTSGKVTLFNHRPEMGQGTFQSIPMVLAEELEVDINEVIIKQSIASRKLYGSQMVVGSRSIQTEFNRLSRMGASAREMLIEAAANVWNISTDKCYASRGRVFAPSGESLPYGDLIVEASKLTPKQHPVLKPASDFKVIGKPIPRRDIPLKVNGSAQFGLDISVPGMLYASVERSPVFLSTIKSYNKEEVLKVAGVKQVLETSRNVFGHSRVGIAVLADSYWAAVQGRKALKVSWDHQEYQAISDASLEQDAKDAALQPGDSLFYQGKPDDMLNGASDVFERQYQTPYQAHVPMEPMNATLSVRKDSAEFWGSTQNPNGIRSFISKKYSIPEEKVKINYTFMGGGFGRRSMIDVVEEAADLSYQSGATVKVIWTREDDQTQGPFRSSSLNCCKAIIEDNKVTALEHKVVAQEIRNQTGDNMTAGKQLMGGINTDYTVPNFSVKGVLRKRHIPISYWRAVYHSTNPFAHESFIDELAHYIGKDPIRFRLDMLENPRFIKVLEVVAEKTGWWQAKPENTGKGVAIAERSGAHFAMVVEVQKQSQGVIPTKITTVLDLGICINPDTVKAQTEGSIVMGLGACYAGLNIEQGGIKQKNFNSYPLLRYDQCPEIKTHIITSTSDPDGAGESGLPTVAPALANAIFDLTGKRIRKLPVDLSKI